MPAGAAPSTLENELKWLAVTTLIIFSALLGSLLLTEGHEWGDDFAATIMQAQSIVEGNPDRFVAENRFTIEKSDTGEIGPVAYPWGTPLLLSPFYRLFGLNILALKSLNVVCYVLFLILLAFFFREKHSGGYFLALISFFALNPRMLISLNDVLSDMPFLLVSTITIFLIGRILLERRRLISSVADHLLLGLLFAVAFFIRQDGINLVLTAAGTQILSGVRRAPGQARHRSSIWRRLLSQASDVKTVFIHLSPYLSFAALAWIWCHLFPHDVSGRTPVSLENASLRLGHLFRPGAGFFDGLPHPAIVVAAGLPFLLIGMVRRLHEDGHILIYAFLTILLYVFSPAADGLGYWLPLLPFYVHFALVGLRWCSEALETRWTGAGKYLAPALLAFVVVYFFQSVRDRALVNIYADRKVSSGPFAEASQDIFSFIREKTPPDSVIVFFNPRVMRMFTDRRSIRLDNTADLSRGSHLCIYLRTDGYNRFPENSVEPLVKSGKLRLMYANSDFRLYEIPA